MSQHGYTSTHRSGVDVFFNTIVLIFIRYVNFVKYDFVPVKFQLVLGISYEFRIFIFLNALFSFNCTSKQHSKCTLFVCEETVQTNSMQNNFDIFSEFFFAITK